MAQIIGVSVAVMAFLALSLAPVAVSQAAGAPEWSGGFPKLVEKNALLQWDPVKGSSEYRVYRTEKKDKDLKQVATVKPNRHIDKDLPPGKTFYYYVTSVVDGKESGRSPAGAVSTPKEVVFVPMKTPELVPGIVKSQADGAASVGIRWEDAAGTDMIGINVYRSLTKGKGYTMIGSTPGSSYEDTDVVRGKTYYYTVTAVDSSFNETKRSNEIGVEVPKLASPKPVAETPPTEMRKAKLLFTITDYDKYVKDEKGKVIKTKAKFGTVHDVVVDEAVGRIYISDYRYGGVLAYDLSGKFQFGIMRDGKDGKEKFANPQGLALGSGGELYVADDDAPEVRSFDIAGKLVLRIDVGLNHLPDFKDKTARIYDVVVNDEGNIYAGETTSNRLHVFDYRGKRLFESEINKDDDKNFHGPSFMTKDREGNIVVVDAGGSRLTVYSPDGKFLRRISGKGFDAGQLSYPSGITLGNEGEVLVASGISPNIQAFDPKTGKFLYAICNEDCGGPIDSSSMRGIHIDSQNRLYVVESRNNKVSVYQLGSETVDVKPE